MAAPLKSRRRAASPRPSARRAGADDSRAGLAWRPENLWWHDPSQASAALVIRARAPLRLGLAGGGTDVSPYCDLYGGAVLNATVDLYAYATIEALEEPRVEFVSADLGDRASYRARPSLKSDGRLDLFKHVYNYVVREYHGGRPLPVRVSTHVDVPMGSGLGASSSLVVAMLKGYAEWLGVPLGDYELAQTAYRIERLQARLPGGKQDQYAAAFGGFNFMEFGAQERVLVNPLRIKDWVVSELEASLLLFYSGRSHAAEAIIAEQMRHVRAGEGPALAAAHQVKQEAFRMKECLLRGDFARMHEVLRQSWEAKRRMAAAICSPRLETLYRRALNAGAYCGRISGAGGAGFMLFLVDPVRKARLSTILRQTYRQGLIFGCHFTSAGTQAWRLK